MTLPNIIREFIKATNAHDSRAFIDTFAEDALVNDFARNFRGKEQIRSWGDKEIIAPKVTFEADKVIEHYGDFLITALTDGNYDKSKAPDPTYLDYFFTVKDDKIVKLIVIKNKEKSANQETILDNNKQSVRQFFNCFSAGDIAGAVALFHDDATYWFPTLRQTTEMRAFAGGLEWILSRLDGPIRFEIGKMVAENNKVAVQLESFTRTIEGMPYNNLYHIYYEFEGAKIKLAREYNDTAHVYKTLRTGQSSLS
jgi:ketosteroid isomerase-like protein